ncbi:MAG: hypothetical protein KAT70_04385 [Thermoplasmata archaeon]|nr:hypothetical protein [Thermoplasmata archaeon]
MDTDLIKQQIKGLAERLTGLRADHQRFTKDQGLRQEEESIRLELRQSTDKIEAAVEKVDELKELKANAISGTCKDLSSKMSEVMPGLEPLVKISEDLKVTIGCNKVPYHGLSGGERVAFDGALSHAMDAGFLILEGAEMDLGRLERTMARMAGVERQVLLLSWAGPEVIPDGWDAMMMDYDADEWRSITQ